MTSKRQRIVVLYCQHCVKSEVASGTSTVERAGCEVQRVMMPCSSKVQVSELLKLLDHGVDGVELVACKDGTCRFMVGSRMAAKRVEYARQLLSAAHVGADRLGMTWESGLTADALVELGLARAKALQPLEQGEVA